MEKSLIILSKREDDLEFATHVAELAGLSFEVATEGEAVCRALEEGKAATIFVDASSKELFQSFEKIVQDHVGVFSDKINPNTIHFISSEDLQDVGYLLGSPLFGHYISRNYGDPKDAAERYGYIVKASLQERAFDLKSLLPTRSKIQMIKFSKTSQKQEGVEAVKNFLLAIKFKSRMATVIANAVDELVMNAMFDAPADEFGNPLYMSTPRDTEMPLEGKRSVEMFVGFDGKNVAITAVDFYGSLDKEKLIKHISKRYTEEAYKVKKTMAGAGIGLATVFRSGGSFIFSCERGVRTEVTVFFKRADNFRAFKDQFRFISTYFYL